MKLKCEACGCTIDDKLSRTLCAWCRPDATPALTPAQSALLALAVAAGPKGIPYSHVGSSYVHFGDARALLRARLVTGERFAIVATDKGRAVADGKAVP